MKCKKCKKEGASIILDGINVCYTCFGKEDVDQCEYCGQFFTNIYKNRYGQVCEDCLEQKKEKEVKEDLQGEMI